MEDFAGQGESMNCICLDFEFVNKFSARKHKRKSCEGGTVDSEFKRKLIIY